MTEFVRYAYADVMELADMQDLGSCTARCRGSTPLIRSLEVPGTGTSFHVIGNGDAIFVLRNLVIRAKLFKA